MEHYFEQLLIVNNRALLGPIGGLGGGIYTNQTFYCINSTIANNFAQGDGGGVACCSWYILNIEQPVNPFFFNTIIYGNQSFVGSNQFWCQGPLCQPQFDYCDMEGWNTNTWLSSGYAWNDCGWNGPPPTLTNIDNFPGYNPPDYSIPNSSPCYNRGSNLLEFPYGIVNTFDSYWGFPYAFDFQGNIRIIDVTIDIGAYEAPPMKKGEDINGNIKPDISKFDIIIKPNPWVHLSDAEIIINTPEISTIFIRIYNALGDIEYQNELTVKGSETLKLNTLVNTLSQGLYVVKVESIDQSGNHEQINKKIVTL
ncbi:MAG: T9SS type A sorting domain-containing protein [Bacteroidetes bacterium]|nr:T9SS type A sorting domain-containing protein [Bacteroidota bacterium]